MSEHVTAERCVCEECWANPAPGPDSNTHRVQVLAEPVPLELLCTDGVGSEWVAVHAVRRRRDWDGGWLYDLASADPRLADPGWIRYTPAELRHPTTERSA
ncbi:hypothetical protein [Bailinhaonella thermotolerans]|nr:hypothetical protein [Bailinhaonella thermotolerans]